jgi:dipeptidyl aminopeptidase/acylaminoacyl peptidase
MSRYFRSILPVIFVMLTATIGDASPTTESPASEELLSINAIRHLATTVQASFHPEFDKQSINGIKQSVVSFSSDGLRQFALVLEPETELPENGWPVIIINHGHHPNPPDYARVKDGSTDRPGDYYRQVPLGFAEKGFMVVVPDFRGHNISEGFVYTEGLLESYWYTRDSIATFKALPSLANANTDSVFMWGHSMGGKVTLRAALALGNNLRAISIWSPSVGNIWESALHYDLGLEGATDTQKSGKPITNQLELDINALPFEFNPAHADPYNYLNQLNIPLNIHHATHDLKSTPYMQSVALVSKLYRSGKTYHFYSYRGDEHMFKGERQKLAISRDAEFFKQFQ